MSETQNALAIDLSALEAEVGALTPEQIRAQLVEIRTKQKVQQKKYHNPERAKAYQKKRNAATKAMAEKVKTLPATDPRFKTLYEQIMAEANEQADTRLAEQAAEVEVEQEEVES